VSVGREGLEAPLPLATRSRANQVALRAPGRSEPARTEAIIEDLAASTCPVVAFKAAVLAGDPAAAVALRERIASSAMAAALLSGRESDGTIATHAYRKWQGPHWTLCSLALIDYPPGDESLRPILEQVHRWLLPRELPGRRTPPGESERARFCASLEGNAIWYSVRLGLDDERTDLLARRLVRWQWPDGGWNCDAMPGTVTSSFQETAIPLRGLWAWWQRTGDAPARDAAERAEELLLSRRLLWHRGDGSLIRPDWGGAVERIHYPIQFYDVLFALEVMAESGHVGDPRCNDAVALLESKRLADGGFPLEEPNARQAHTIESRASFADWGPAGHRRSNPLVSLEAFRVLEARGRVASVPTPDRD